MGTACVIKLGAVIDWAASDKKMGTKKRKVVLKVVLGILCSVIAYECREARDFKWQASLASCPDHCYYRLRDNFLQVILGEEKDFLRGWTSGKS